MTSGHAKAVVTLRRPEPTVQPVLALWKDGHLDRHDLGALDAEQTAQLLESVLAAPVEPRTARRMHERSAGNLLMLRELTHAAIADDSLQLRHGAWVQRDSGLRPGVRVTDLLGDRLGDLGAADLAAAELVAVAGDAVD